MRAQLLRALFVVATICSLASCSSEDSGEAQTADSAIVQNYDYDAEELELAKQINDHRVSIGLNELQTINHISYKSEEHNEYMIQNNVVNHDYFEERSNNIRQVLGAVKVNENIAYNYTTPAGVLHAWLQSVGHKSNIEGEFSHFGISISEDQTGKKYYTNIFIKK